MTSDSAKIRSVSGKGVSSFVVAQLLIVGIAVAGISYRYQRLESVMVVPPLLETPREIAPQPMPGDIEVIGDEQLRRVLLKLRPVLNRDTGVARVDHNLRFWGVEATFQDPRFVSGEAMQTVLLDHSTFRKTYGPDADEKPLLIDVEETGGIRLRDFDGPLSSSHNDHTMACLSEVGTALSHPVVTPNRQATFREIVEQSFRDFSLNQLEYEWSALTYALHVKDVNKWTTSEGQTISFDDLARRIMRQEMPQGVCFGNHRLHTLTVILRVDDVWKGSDPMLSPAVRQEIVDYLQGMTVRLIDHQHDDGFWNSKWPDEKPSSKAPTDAVGDRLSDRIIATGHALEWWALVPKQDREAVLPPDPSVYREAAQWLVRTIDELPEPDVHRYSPFLSHAGRALALWRGKFPHQVILTTDDEEPSTSESPSTKDEPSTNEEPPPSDDAVNNK